VPRGHREALLAAARVLLRRRGLRATTARDLVEESGTNLASIGYHFGSKDALMATALAEACAEWTARPNAAAAAATERAGDEPGDALLAAIRAMLGDLTERRSEILAFTEGVVAHGRGDVVGETLPASTARSLDAVAATMQAAAPGLPPELAGAGAAVVVALHDGLAQMSTLAPERVPEPDVVALVLAAFGAVLAPSLGVDPEQLRAIARGEASPGS
jgi:AcrR family transcriptional regulator